LLNLEHLGAGFGEHQRCQWSGKQRGKIKDKKTVQRLQVNASHLATAGFCHPPCAASRIPRTSLRRHINAWSVVERYWMRQLPHMGIVLGMHAHTFPDTTRYTD